MAALPRRLATAAVSVGSATGGGTPDR